MDPITHTLTGVALSRAGLSRATPLATATLIIAANVPDIDVAVYAFGNGYDALALRRGWTHGPLAMALLPFLTAGAVLAWDRWVRRARDPSAPPARGRAVLLLALLGVLTHPLLDWMNTYGIRLLMPFEDRWFYGDALFIVDPWVWLGLGAAVVLGRGRGEGGTIERGGSDAREPTVARGERRARAVGALVVAYIIAMVVAGATAERYVRDTANARLDGRVRDVMVGPVPANPFAGQVVVETADAYHTGRFSWLQTPRLTLDGPRLPTLAPDPVIEAAATTPDARNYLTWSRFPYAHVDTLPNGYHVRFGDARYPDGRAGSLSGVTVEVGLEAGVGR